MPETSISSEEADFIAARNKLITAILKSYELTVSELARNRAKGTIDNDYIQQAEILFKYIIPTASKKIYIYTGSFSTSFYNQPSIISSFEEFINKESERSVVVICENNENFDSIKTHPTYGRSEFSFVWTNGEKVNNGHHFIVTDSNAYREEKGNDRDSHENYKASASFNDESKAKELVEKLEKFINDADND